jgi:hypothetical protein
MNEKKRPHGVKRIPLRRGYPEEFTPIDEAVSTLGKYSIAYGQHFRPELCYDIVAHNNDTGEVIRRHYNEAVSGPGYREASLRFWEKFKQDMMAPRGPSEEDEKDEYRIITPN